MGYDYSKLQNTAKSLIERFGAAAVLTRSNNSSTNINPVTGVVTSHAATTGNFYAVSVPSNSSSDFDNKIIGEASLMGKVARFFVATQNGTTMIPSGQGDTLTFDSTVHIVLGATVISPAGTVTTIVFKIGCTV